VEGAILYLLADLVDHSIVIGERVEERLLFDQRYEFINNFVGPVASMVNLHEVNNNFPSIVFL
jgi:hypothetical protein